MTRFACKLALALLLIFSVLSAAVRSLAFDPVYFEHVRALFTPPPDCPPPCLFGIRPGITPVDAVPGILAAFPWINGLDVVDWRITSASVDWNPGSPETSSRRSQLSDIRPLGPKVYTITLQTDIPFGVLWLALGRPALGTVDHSFHVAAYPEWGFYVRTSADCYGFWREPATLILVLWRPPFPVYGSMRTRICRQGVR